MNASGVRTMAAAVLFVALDAAAATPQLKVRHDGSFQGISALLAVRACVQHHQDFVLDVADRDAPQGVVVELLDAEGTEVGRHVGSKGVCGFARYAAEYFRLDQDIPVAGPSVTDRSPRPADGAAR